MRFLFLIFALISSAFAGGFIPHDQVGVKDFAGKVFVKRKDCKAHYAKKCVKLPKGYVADYFVSVDEMKDDRGRPLWSSRADQVACSGESDCRAKLKELVCAGGSGWDRFIAAGFDEVYCARITGFEQRATGDKIAVEDASKKAAHMAAVAAESSAKADKKTKRKQAKGFISKLKSGSDLSKAELRQVLLVLLKDLRK